MRFRLFAILLLVLLLSLVLSSSPSAIQSQPPMALVCFSPPQRLELPAGQGIEVRCGLVGERLQGERQETSVVFRVDGMPLRVEQVPTDGIVTFAWQPTQTGPHTLMISAGVGSREVMTVARQVLVMPAGSPVRVP
jgi:hypothetical protein